MKPILVTTYINPDLDGFASVLAYAELLNKTGFSAQSYFSGQLLSDAAFVAGQFRIDYFDQPTDPGEFDRVVVLDLSDLNRLDEKIKPQNVIEVIDHRPVSDPSAFPNARYRLEMIGAASTIVAEIFKEKKVEMSSETAKLLCCAIAVHNLDFKSPGATQRDHQAFDWLKEKSGFETAFVREIFLAISSLPGPKLAETMENDFKWLDVSGRKVGVAQVEIVNGKDLVGQREKEILDKLADLKNKLFLDFVFLTVTDVEESVDYWVADDSRTRELLKKVFGVEFTGKLAQTSRIILRKEIFSSIKRALEN